MATIKRYLYDGLSFSIESGRSPVLVDNTLIHSKVSIPKVIWSIDFGSVDEPLKNAIEQTVFSEPNSTFIECAVGPSYVVGKYQPVFGSVKYFMTYLFEYKYYNGFVDRELSYTVDGAYHVLENGLRVPDNQSPTSPMLVCPSRVEIKRKLFYMNSKTSIEHMANGIYKLRMNFTEAYRLLNLGNTFLIGASDANYINCS